MNKDLIGMNQGPTGRHALIDGSLVLPMYGGGQCPFETIIKPADGLTVAWYLGSRSFTSTYYSALQQWRTVELTFIDCNGNGGGDNCNFTQTLLFDGGETSSLDVSPDGQWAARTSATAAEIFDTVTGLVVSTQTVTDPAFVRFSPLGHWLWVSSIS